MDLVQTSTALVQTMTKAFVTTRVQRVPAKAKKSVPTVIHTHTEMNSVYVHAILTGSRKIAPPILESAINDVTRAPVHLIRNAWNARSMQQVVTETVYVIQTLLDTTVYYTKANVTLSVKVVSIGEMIRGVMLIKQQTATIVFKMRIGSIYKVAIHIVSAMINGLEMTVLRTTRAIAITRVTAVEAHSRKTATPVLLTLIEIVTESVSANLDGKLRDVILGLAYVIIGAWTVSGHQIQTAEMAVSVTLWLMSQTGAYVRLNGVDNIANVTRDLVMLTAMDVMDLVTLSVSTV